MKKEIESNHMYELCKSHMHAYVLAELVDGTTVDGIITGLDDEHVYFAVPIDYSDQSFQHDSSDRQFGYGYPGYGYGYGYPSYGYPRRRFRRLILPLTALAALSILPWY